MGRRPPGFHTCLTVAVAMMLPLLAPDASGDPATPRPHGQRAARQLDLAQNPKARQKLLRLVQRNFAWVYNQAEDRQPGSPTFLQPGFSAGQRVRWDKLRQTALDAISTAPAARVRVEATRKDDGFGAPLERTLRVELLDGPGGGAEQVLGKLLITRRSDVTSYRKEKKVTIELQGQGFATTRQESPFQGEFSTVQAMGSVSTCSRCIVPESDGPLFKLPAGARTPSDARSFGPGKDRAFAPSRQPLEDYIYPSGTLKQLRESAPQRVPASSVAIASARSRLVATLKELPALRWIRQRYNRQDKLAPFKLIAHQHLVGNTGALLLESGLKPENVHLWGKPYSIEPRVVRDLQQLGFHFYGGDVSGDYQRIEQLIEGELAQIKNPQQIRKPRFLVLDDGGELISHVVQVLRKHPHHAHLFAAVEQTTKGRRRLKELALPFRVIDVAGSPTKIDASPIYGHAIGKEVRRLVDKYRQVTQDQLVSAVVIGYGNIGEAVAHGLKRYSEVMVYDPDPAQQERARAAGFKVAGTKDEALSRAQILVSCVGKPTLTTDDLLKLPVRAVVANGGSAHEFDLHQSSYLRRNRIGANAVFYTHRDTGSLDHETTVYTIDRQGTATQQVYVAKAGGVINFARRPDTFGGSAVPSRYIQLDVGMLFLGLLQASAGGKPGIEPLDGKRQVELSGFVKNELAKRGESLEHPRW